MQASYFIDRLTYDPKTGVVFWKERPRSDFKDDHSWKIFSSRCAGKEAGHKSFDQGRPKCIQIRINRKLFAAHRIIYMLMGVEIPAGFEVDHKDTNPFNNRWNNLRLATRVQNAANQNAHRNRKHPHLPKGVSTKGKRFRAQIGWNGKQIRLGSFPTAAEAAAAYSRKASELYKDFARSGHSNV